MVESVGRIESEVQADVITRLILLSIFDLHFVDDGSYTNTMITLLLMPCGNNCSLLRNPHSNRGPSLMIFSSALTVATADQRVTL